MAQSRVSLGEGAVPTFDVKDKTDPAERPLQKLASLAKTVYGAVKPFQTAWEKHQENKQKELDAKAPEDTKERAKWESNMANDPDFDEDESTFLAVPDKKLPGPKTSMLDYDEGLAESLGYTDKLDSIEAPYEYTSLPVIDPNLDTGRISKKFESTGQFGEDSTDDLTWKGWKTHLYFYKSPDGKFHKWDPTVNKDVNNLYEEVDGEMVNHGSSKPYRLTWDSPNAVVKASEGGFARSGVPVQDLNRAPDNVDSEGRESDLNWYSLK